MTAQYNVDRNAIVIGRLNMTCIVGKEVVRVCGGLNWGQVKFLWNI